MSGTRTAYDSEFSNAVRALRKEANCQTTDQYLDWLERAVLSARSVYLNPPKVTDSISQKAEPDSHGYSK